jgi:hypothetical protein
LENQEKYGWTIFENDLEKKNGVRALGKIAGK